MVSPPRVSNLLVTCQGVCILYALASKETAWDPVLLFSPAHLFLLFSLEPSPSCLASCVRQRVSELHSAWAGMRKRGGWRGMLCLGSTSWHVWFLSLCFSKQTKVTVLESHINIFYGEPGLISAILGLNLDVDKQPHSPSPSWHKAWR